ncbi:hypothetical protein VSR01_17585 [Actinacidiphila sp. DG2A-62]|nr:hypothetical protein [Actinacidiphila sp. DG2A-62]MEC3995252.1 hypothetical protein [Actinacidiphila sp. DG2A-62]
MAYAEKRTARGKIYFRACFQRPDRKAQDYIKDADGRAVRYPTKTTAQKAAEKAEADAFEAAKKGRWVPPEQEAAAARVTFGAFAQEQMNELSLADSTMQNYPRSLAHLLPTFGDTVIRDITESMVNTWEREQLTHSAPSSVRTYRALLHRLLADAVDAGHADKNVAERRRGRGRRHGRGGHRGPEKAITTMLGSLLIAERASLLSGRDDEFVAHIHKTYTGMRWGNWSAWRRSTRARKPGPSGSSGSCTSWTPAASPAARPRTTATAASTRRPSSRASSASTSPAPSPPLAPATA